MRQKWVVLAMAVMALVTGGWLAVVLVGSGAPGWALALAGALWLMLAWDVWREWRER